MTLDGKRLFAVRVALLQDFLEARGLDGVLLTRPDNFAMATGGKRNYVYRASDAGANALLAMADGSAFFVGDTIERPRLEAEELAGLDCGYLDYLWFAGDPASRAAEAFPRARLASDDGSLGENVHAALAPLRAALTETELEKYRRLGALAAEAMTAALAAITPGMTEADAAAALIAEGARRRCHVPVALTAADERIARYRHPLPSEAGLLEGGGERRIDRYVMVVGCFLREGLVASITRFKQVDETPPGIAEAYARICGVDALMQEATAEASKLGEVFAACQAAYARLGFDAEEWHKHHQGGATGYAGRTCKGRPGERFAVLDAHWEQAIGERLGERVRFGQAFAWNPSGPGVKSEDTFVLWPDRRTEIVTGTPALPPVDLAAVLGRGTASVKSGMAR